MSVMLAGFILCTVLSAPAQLSITEVTWNSIGLRSVMNNASQQNASPYRYPVGVRVTNNFVDFGYVDPVLYVSIEEMSASTAGPGSPAILAWTTGEEIDNAGFHIWRAEWNPTERLWLPFSRITSTLLPSEAGFTGGASYTFADPVLIQEGETRRVYYVEDIDFAGVSTFHGPIILDIVSDTRSGVDEWMSY
jgi:hypothetical protein